jgi:hypothetical protein
MPVLLLCAGIGVVQARQSLCAALIYSGGQFRPYSATVLIPAGIRFACVAALLIMRVKMALPMLVANDLVSSLLGWLCGSLWLRRLRTQWTVWGAAGHAPMLSQQAHRLLRSGMIPTFLEAMALQSAVLVGGALGTGVAVATFGVFVRAIQIIKVVLDPLIAYGERRLRLASPDERRRAEFYFLASVGTAYSLVGAGILIVYKIAGAFFKHYALGHTSELTICLSLALVAFMYLCLDSVLLSRGYANFRLIGTILQISTALLVIGLVHPASLSQLVFLNGVIAVPRFAFYAWYYLRRLSDRVAWNVWIAEAGGCGST